MAFTYRGYAIHRTAHFGNYWSSAFGSGHVAATRATIKRWIDQAIASGEIRRLEGD